MGLKDFDITMQWLEPSQEIKITGLAPDTEIAILVNEVEQTVTTNSQGEALVQFGASIPPVFYMVRVSDPGELIDERIGFSY